MGLGFNIRTRIRNIKTFKRTVEKLAAESGYHAEHDESATRVRFCKLGDLFLNYQYEGKENTDDIVSVTGECQTNLLGPGFHKAAIAFIDRLQQATDTRFEVEDETEYYTERDFEAMKKKHFHKWLAKLFEIIQEQEDKGSTSLSICWDFNKYYPQSDSGIVISPLGSFRLSEVIRRIREEGIESFADDFFIWNNPERDARFHRGLALNAMWEDCYFMPSERSEEDARINGYIISELETAASLDPSLPFPKRNTRNFADCMAVPLSRLTGCRHTKRNLPSATGEELSTIRSEGSGSVCRAAISKIRMMVPSSIMMRLQTTGTRSDVQDTPPMVSRIFLMWKRK